MSKFDLTLEELKKYMPKRFYHAHVLPIFNYGVRTDNESNPFALSTDVHKSSGNIVMKLTNTNPPYEGIKFTACKKLK